MEIGATEALQAHVSRRVAPPRRVSQRRLDFERWRPRWLREVIAEATGVFLYVFPGIASVAAFTLNGASPVGVSAFSSIFQIGWAFALGIAFAIIVCAPTSGGHFNPAVTMCLVIWQGFPIKKACYYVAGQIFGSFMAGMLVMGMYWVQIQEMKNEFLAAGKPLVAGGAPASILCAFPAAEQTNLGYVAMTEFFVDSFIGMVIWACIDPSNPFITPGSIPVLIGLGYGVMIWGFADNTISTNLARDLGTRIVAAIFFGKEAFTYRDYSPIAILVNLPATLFATAYYELVMRDSLLVMAKGQAVHEQGEPGLMRHFSKIESKDMVRGHEDLEEANEVVATKRG